MNEKRKNVAYNCNKNLQEKVYCAYFVLKFKNNDAAKHIWRTPYGFAFSHDVFIIYVVRGCID